MKTITFKEFAEMPEGTIFSYFEPMICTGIHRKGETIFDGDRPIDYFEESLVADCWNGEPPTVGDGVTRWGLFEFDQQYAIYESGDIETLVSLLQNTEDGNGEAMTPKHQ